MKLLDQLDELKNQFTPDTARRVERLLAQLSRQKLNDTDSLVCYHEILLFLRAYPQNAAMLRATSGLMLGPEKAYLLETRLAPLLYREKLPDLDALAAVLQAGTPALAREVVEAMTTNETSFFRDGLPFEHVRTRALPDGWQLPGSSTWHKTREALTSGVRTSTPVRWASWTSVSDG